LPNWLTDRRRSATLTRSASGIRAGESGRFGGVR
jgi:hypothetical protein